MLTDEMVKKFQQGADQYIAKMKSMPKQQAKDFATNELIKMGVLNRNGKPKKTIVTGDFFGW